MVEYVWLPWFFDIPAYAEASAVAFCGMGTGLALVERPYRG